MLFSVLALYLLAFLALPVGAMVLRGVTNTEGRFSTDHLTLLLANPVYLESLGNSLVVACGAALLAALAALPIAMLLWRHHVRPSIYIELCGFLPLFVPPFVLALSLQNLLGRGGALGWLLGGDLDPAILGLPSVMLVEALHYFPLVLMTLVMTTSASSQQACEAARLGSSWWRLMTRIFLPLGMPGLAFGMSITFLKAMDDLATPLSLGVTNLLAPQAFFRVSAYGSQDPLSSLIATLMVVISALAWLASIRLVRQHVSWRSGAFAAAAPSRRQTIVGLSCLGGIVMLYATLYAGVALTSIARIWSYTLLPESFTLSHYLTALGDERGSFINTLIYCGFAAVVDVLVGLLMAYAIDRAAPRWKTGLTWAAAGLLSVPGVALAIAYLQFFRVVELPFFNQTIDASWFMLPMAFSVRGLPFAIRACTIALQRLPKSYVDAASLSGGSRLRVATKIVLPMLAFGLFVAFLLCFGVAAVDLSSAMLLVPSETDAPVAYSIYLNMQSTTGRGAGSALAVLSIALVTLSLFVLLALLRPKSKAASSFRKFVFTAS
ncbi:MAG: iron transporter permease [Proteobacteria bacterium]|nr:iron transporter permease [Pseudomonadota bacterium]